MTAEIDVNKLAQQLKAAVQGGAGVRDVECMLMEAIYGRPAADPATPANAVNLREARPRGLINIQPYTDPARSCHCRHKGQSCPCRAIWSCDVLGGHGALVLLCKDHYQKLLPEILAGEAARARVLAEEEKHEQQT